jgi:hypothetical protein
MTDTQTTQTAVDETKTPATPGAEAVQDARTDGDDLDTLLKEYDQTAAPPAAAKPAQPEPTGTGTTPATPAIDPAVADVQRYIFRQDMDKTVKAIRGDLDPEMFDDTTVRGWINARADDDPRLAQAWVNRHNNPKQFEKVVAQLGRDFQKKFSKMPDKGATEDRAAVTAAVRGTSTKAPEGQAPNYAGMNNAEYREAHKRDYGYYPNV